MPDVDVADMTTCTITEQGFKVIVEGKTGQRFDLIVNAVWKVLTPTAVAFCRKCRRPIGKWSDSIGTAATCVGEGTYSFHKECFAKLSAEEKAEANRVGSELFGD